MNPMVLDRAECERASTIPNLTTAIMATCQSKIECLMWSVFSLLFRSTKTLEHIIVSINGPDKRTGDTSPQDRKQAFLEELRNTRWKNPAQGIDRDMPLTVMRTWSRIGHSQALDMAIPWVHTEYYTIMHDDIIVNTYKWCEDTLRIMEDRRVGMVYCTPRLSTGLSYVNHGDEKKINLPHPNTVFITSRKELYTGMGFRWSGHHVKKKFKLEDNSELATFHGEDVNHLPPNGEYGYISLDVGTLPYYRMKKAGYKFVPLPEDAVTHLTAMSWRDESGQKAAFNHNQEAIAKLVSLIYTSPEYRRIYERYLPTTSEV